MPLDRFGSLQIDEQMQFQRHEWTFQKIGWSLMILLVIAGLLGFVGEGPFSSSETGSEESGLQLQYDRFLHYADPTVLDLKLGPADGDRLSLRINTEFLRSTELLSIVPEPLVTHAGREFHLFEFAVAQPETPLLVQIRFEPQLYGNLLGEFSVDRKPAVAFRQYVYP